MLFLRASQDLFIATQPFLRLNVKPVKYYVSRYKVSVIRKRELSMRVCERDTVKWGEIALTEIVLYSDTKGVLEFYDFSEAVN